MPSEEQQPEESVGIEVKKENYYLGLWFISDRESHDWLATAYRKPDRPMVTIVKYRFRYYNPESQNRWDNKDEKSWYCWEANKADEATVERMVNEMFQLLIATGFGNDAYALPVHGDGEAFFEVLKNAPFAEMKQVVPE